MRCLKIHYEVEHVHMIMTGQGHGYCQLCIKQQIIHIYIIEDLEMKRKGGPWLLNKIDMMDEEINAQIFGN